jgi:hypothetical protein
MSNLKNTDKQKLEKLFCMDGGYVLDFSNRTFADFFTTLNIDIYDDKFSIYGGSKANHLRAFWDTQPDEIVGKTLEELLERWRTDKMLGDQDITTREQILEQECKKIALGLSGTSNVEPETEKQFLAKHIEDIDLSKLDIGGALKDSIDQRHDEIRKCLKVDAPLAAIFLCGSTLEGILLDIATKHPADFNQTVIAPVDKKTGKPLELHQWTLSQLIDAACELGIIQEDVKKFSSSLRDFRNYMHPHQQAISKFSPSVRTAEICYKVLQLAIMQASEAK